MCFGFSFWFTQILAHRNVKKKLLLITVIYVLRSAVYVCVDVSFSVKTKSAKNKLTFFHTQWNKRNVHIYFACMLSFKFKFRKGKKKLEMMIGYFNVSKFFYVFQIETISNDRYCLFISRASLTNDVFNECAHVQHFRRTVTMNLKRQTIWYHRCGNVNMTDSGVNIMKQLMDEKKKNWRNVRKCCASFEKSPCIDLGSDKLLSQSIT